MRLTRFLADGGEPLAGLLGGGTGLAVDGGMVGLRRRHR